MTRDDGARWDRSGPVRLVDSDLGGPVVELQARGGRAVVALQGAQVLSYVPTGGRDVLWLSPVARLGTGKAVRGGIPVCWPWFGPHPSDRAMPAHGLVRAVPWRVIDRAASETDVRVRLGWPTIEGSTGQSGSHLRLHLDVKLGDALTLELVTTNDGPAPVAITQALHTYVAVGDIGSTEIGDLDACDYIDQLDAGAMKRQCGPVRFDGEIDRIYLGSPPVITIRDGSSPRRIVVAATGSASTVVWNPWIEKAARLGDVGADGYRRFVCVETANAGTDVRTLAPGATHALSATLRCDIR